MQVRRRSDVSESLREANARELADIKRWVWQGTLVIATVLITRAIANSYLGAAVVAVAIGLVSGLGGRVVKRRRAQPHDDGSASS